MAVRAKHRSKLTALQRQWLRLQMSENSRVGRTKQKPMSRCSRGGHAVGNSAHLACVRRGRLGVRIPAATDISKNR